MKLIRKEQKLTDGIAKRFSGLGIKDYQVQDVLQKLGLISINPKNGKIVTSKLLLKN